MGAEFEAVVVLTTRSSSEWKRFDGSHSYSFLALIFFKMINRVFLRRKNMSNAKIEKNKFPFVGKKSLSFIDDPRRVNVALTRARRMVFVIGEKQVWERTNEWGRLVL